MSLRVGGTVTSRMVSFSSKFSGTKLHLVTQDPHLLGGDIDADEWVAKVHTSTFATREHERSHVGLDKQTICGFVIDLNRFDSERVGTAQYSENIATTVSSTMLALVKSVAVHSMKTFFVLRVILLWSPLMIGGRDSTTSFESKTTG